jgi:hypothetical protein
MPPQKGAANGVRSLFTAEGRFFALLQVSLASSNRFVLRTAKITIFFETNPKKFVTFAPNLFNSIVQWKNTY